MADHVIETETRWKVVDEASASAEKIEHAFGKTGKAAEVVREKVGEAFQEGKGHALAMAAATLGVGLTLEGLKDKVTEVTREYQGTQHAVQGVLFSMLKWPKGVDILERVHRSGALSKLTMQGLEETSYKYATSLQDVAEGYKMATVAAGALHLNEKQRQDLTEKATAASKIFGGTTASNMELIGRVLQTKTIRGMDQLAVYLREKLPQGAKNLHRMTEGGLFAALNKAMKDLPAGAAAMATTASDNMTRIHKSVDEAFRGLFGPTTQWMAEKTEAFMKKLNTTMKDGKTTIEAWGGRLLHFFQEVRAIADFVLDHWKEAAAIWATFKTVDMFSKGAAAGGFLDKLGAADKGLETFSGKLQTAVIGLGLLALAAKGLAELIDQKQTRDIARQSALGKGGSYDASFQAFASGKTDLARKQLQSIGLMTPQGDVTDRSMLMKALRDDKDMLHKMGDTLGRSALLAEMKGLKPGSEKFVSAEALLNPNLIADAFVRALKEATPLGPEFKPDWDMQNKDKWLKTTGAPKIDIYGGVHITQDFKDQDPDAVFLRFRDDLEDQAMHKIQSAHADFLEP